MTWKIYLKQNQSRFIGELVDFVSIPSVSAVDEHFDDVVKAGNWVVKRLKTAGISNARLMHTETHPVVYGDWLNAGTNKPTILIYGHFDVQPADPLNYGIARLLIQKLKMVRFLEGVRQTTKETCSRRSWPLRLS